MFCRHLTKKFSNSVFQIEKIYQSTSSNLRMVTTLSWSQVIDADELSRPISRSSHGLSVFGDTLYLFGGENEPRTPIDSQIHSIDLSDGEKSTWQSIGLNGSEVPPPRVAHCQSTVGNKIFIFGGRQGKAIDERPMNDLYCFDINTKEWTELSQCEGTLPCPRSFHCMVSVGTSLFVFGGCGPEGKRLSDLHEYDTVKKSWVCHTEGPMSGRGGAGLAISSDGKKLFVLGGFSGHEMDDMYEYHIENRVWRKLESKLPEPRSVFVTITVGEYLVVYGGELSPSQHGHEGAGNFSGSVLIFKETEGTLTRQTTKQLKATGAEPTPRGWTSGVTFAGKKGFAVFGGLTGDDVNPKRLNDLWICKIDE